ncbi:hypothetical protein PRIPAC_90036 [Pristionchus pacificus]|nr:hypothetical protein PRIPAC_90036 [Pristionchus pacificus]
MARAKHVTAKNKQVATASHRCSGGVMKPHPYQKGVVCLREIRRYQKSVELLIKKAPFERLVREILLDFCPTARIAKDAVEALQEACEAAIIRLLNLTGKNAIHRKSVTIAPKDLRFAAVVLGLIHENSEM